MSVQDFQENYRNGQGVENAVKSTKGGGTVYTYKPTNKGERDARRRIFERFTAMRDAPERKEAEKRWDLGDKMYQMWAPSRDADDWRADIVLPDGFAAVQTHMQDTVQLRPRPSLDPVEGSDANEAAYVNHIFQFAMDKTEFDFESYKARNCSAIRGDAYTIEEYRYEKRTVKYPVSTENGEIKYEKREIIDYDDVYTRHVDNFSVYFDESVDDYKYAADCIYREVMTHDTFKAQYAGRPGFINVDKVVPAGKLDQRAGFFQKASDISYNDVEILHYHNKQTDSYDALCNNVIIRNDAMPSTHKELPIDKWTFYPITGSMYGMGIPFIIHTIVEERRSGRNMSSDRNKMQLQKMFITNDLFDIDEEDLTPRPHGLVPINTNGQPLSSVIMPLEYGDVPASSLRFDDSLLAEERRAHGLDDRPAQTAGGTATESAIISEAAQKRINLINTIQNWSTLTRLGKKKWKNIQFFYPAGRMEDIMVDNKIKRMKTYKTIKVNGAEYRIKGDLKNGEHPRIVASPYQGTTSIKLDATYSRFMQCECDIIVNAASNVYESHSVKFAKNKELSFELLANPLTASSMDPQKVVKNLYQLNHEEPKNWMRGDGMTDAEFRDLAELENKYFIDMAVNGEVFALPGTPNATEAHTEEHINFTATKEYEALPQTIKDVITQHILEEHDANPNTGSVAEKLQALGIGGEAPTAPGSPEAAGGPAQGGGGNAVVPGGIGGPAVSTPPMGAAPVTGGDVTAAVA